MTVVHGGKEVHCIINLIRSAYSYQLQVIFNEHTLFLEPDEEGCYRMVIMPWQDKMMLETIDKSLVTHIIDTIQEELKS